jgi:peptide/nickel transport system substrate-binding protein
VVWTEDPRGRMVGPVRRTLICLVVVVLTGCSAATVTGPASQAPKHGGTLRVGMSDATYFSMDPQREYSGNSWELFRCCLLQTLMSYSNLNGQPGTQPQPDLAAAPPVVSLDGTTWTFRLRPGLHYAPPLQDVPITSSDIVRALLRLGDPATGQPLLADYFSVIDGYAAYLSGDAETISGLETPDPLTLRVRETRPDATLPFVFSMAVSAPIPPMPGHPEERFGVATGHVQDGNLTHVGGYGQFLVASGPYMYEGSASMDFSVPPDQQTPASGYTPWRLSSDFFDTGKIETYGSITLVRNPSWDPATDPLRAALADRIEVTGGPTDELFRSVAAGDLDLVFDAPPPPAELRRYQDDPALRPLIQTTDGLSQSLAIFNLAQPPFDDVAVRHAVADVIDRATIVAESREGYIRGVSTLTNHLSPDATEASLLSGWSPFPTDDGSPSLDAARQAMASSRYAKGGRCRDPACDGVTILVHPGLDAAAASLRTALAKLGIHAHVEITELFWDRCPDPTKHIGLCIGLGWQSDFPDAVNFLSEMFDGHGGINWTQMGASPSQLRRWGYDVRDVPSVDGDVERCVREPGSAKPACWARLDQYLTGVLVAAVPLVVFQPLRLSSPGLGAFPWDDAYGEPALDRLPGRAA